jgi:hypothetical protein
MGRFAQLSAATKAQALHPGGEIFPPLPQGAPPGIRLLLIQGTPGALAPRKATAKTPRAAASTPRPNLLGALATVRHQSPLVARLNQPHVAAGPLRHFIPTTTTGGRGPQPRAAGAAAAVARAAAPAAAAGPGDALLQADGSLHVPPGFSQTRSAWNQMNGYNPYSYIALRLQQPQPGPSQRGSSTSAAARYQQQLQQQQYSSFHSFDPQAQFMASQQGLCEQQGTAGARKPIRIPALPLPP